MVRGSTNYMQYRYEKLALDEICTVDINSNIGAIGHIFAANGGETIFVTDSGQHLHGIITVGDFFRKAVTSRNIDELLNKNYKKIEVDAFKEIDDAYIDDVADKIFADIPNIRRIPVINTGKLINVIDNVKIPIGLTPSRYHEYCDEKLDKLIRDFLTDFSIGNPALAINAYEALQDRESKRLFSYLYLLKYNKAAYNEMCSLHLNVILESLKCRLTEKGKNLSGYNVYDNFFFLSKQYFQLSDPEWAFNADGGIFLDCGVYDGGTIKDFVEYCGGKYDKIYGFEPIPSQYESSLKNIEKYGIQRVELIQKGVYSHKASLKFSSELSSSKIDGRGTVSVEVVSIDEILSENENVTFIKMDIEGGELEALKGAEKTIRRCKPKLAICIYHKPQDIIEIPSFIISILPNYRFYIRHHELALFETVLYALPPKEDHVCQR